MTLLPHCNLPQFIPFMHKWIEAPKYMVDIGPGLRPFTLWKAPIHLCVEPHNTYANALVQAQYPVIQTKALQGLKILADKSVDLVMMADVIEHMEKEEGFACIAEAKRCSKQICIFTPNGFAVQSGTKENGKDPWGYDGNEWQKHRSGWGIDDFPSFVHHTVPHFWGQSNIHEALMVIWKTP